MNKKLPKYSTSKFYSMDQMRKAVNFYLEHGKNLNLAVEVLGYPSRPGTLSAWIDEFAPGEKRVCKTGHAPVEYTQEVKE